MRTWLLALSLCAAPALAREVRGRVSHTGEGSGQPAGASVLRVVTQTGDLVTVTAQEGLTRVSEGGRAAAVSAVRANTRIRAVVDDSCSLESGSCVARQIDIEQASGLTRIEALK